MSSGPLHLFCLERPNIKNELRETYGSVTDL